MKVENFLQPWKNRNGNIYIYDISVLQKKGLRQDEGDDLMASAYADGYGFQVDSLCFDFAINQVRKISKESKVKLNILEVGGGYGCFYDSISEEVENFFNIEPSDLEGDSGFCDRLRGDNYFHVKSSAEQIPLHDDTMDLIVSLASLDHIPDVNLALSEIRRVLKPGGKFVFTLNNKRSWWKIILSNSEFLRRREALILKDHYILWGPSDAKEVIGSYLSSVSLSTTCFVPQIPFVWKLLLRPLEKIGGHTNSLVGGNLLGVYEK